MDGAPIRRVFAALLLTSCHFVCQLAPQAVLAQQVSTPSQTVVSQGLGKDLETAIKNAAENALAQVVGTFIDTEQQIQKRTEILNGIRNETKSISSNTRSYSQGSIQSVEVLNTENRDGFVSIQARFAVRIEDFKAYIKKVAVGETQIPQGLFAQMSVAAENSIAGQDMVFETILKPIGSGEVVDFALGTIIPLDGSELAYLARGLQESLAGEVDNNRRNFYAWSHGIFRNCDFDVKRSAFMKLYINLNCSFLENLNMKIDKIATAKSNSVDLYNFCAKRDKNALCLTQADNPTSTVGNGYMFNGILDSRLEKFQRELKRPSILVSIKDTSGRNIAIGTYDPHGAAYCSRKGDFRLLAFPLPIENERDFFKNHGGKERESLLHWVGGSNYRIRTQSAIGLVMELPLDTLARAASISVTYGQK